MRILALLFIPFCLWRCGDTRTTPSGKKSFFDSVVSNYIRITDSIRPEDTNAYSYRLLKAYFQKDSSFFDQCNRDFQEAMKQFEFENLIWRTDSCVHLPLVAETGADEVYRFSHSQSFCFFGQYITVCRYGDSVVVDYVEYAFEPDGRTATFTHTDGRKITVNGCRLMTKTTQKITLKDWYELEKKVEAADYWGLNSLSKRVLLDGSSWRIEGYRKQNDYSGQALYHSVSRQCGCTEAFIDLGKYMLQLSGQTTLCGDFF